MFYIVVMKWITHVSFDLQLINTFLTCNLCVCALFLLLLSSHLSIPPTITEPVVDPSTDRFIAFNSPDNVTYTCTVSSSRQVVWEVGRSQIRSEEQFNDIEDVGVFIDPRNTMSSMSTITISEMAREALNTSEILVLCLSVQGISSIPSNTVRVITFRELHLYMYVWMIWLCTLYSYL